ncbi:hypothetical protein OIU34_36580 [Pararhizobium sp. BT-229]|uniref:hypothetical protein n=1 Tax=Pararhizobium sp. BT-229 TaxID=2986923 RepID=UPI0021F72A1D|nr:hypothetical protein [Pararhizobium sp. BT-229]MCV9967355.1 hypothetical protein [Pararhizobium sp. BT-229]
MKIVLVIFFLTTRSSYLNNTETNATDDAFDTIQFLATNNGAWRIKTYATDQDVYVWSVGGTPDDIVSLARQNTEKHYGDVLSEGYVIETTDGVEGVRRELRKRGISDHLEIAKNGMLFWTPRGSQYRTRSKPQ